MRLQTMFSYSLADLQLCSLHKARSKGASGRGEAFIYSPSRSAIRCIKISYACVAPSDSKDKAPTTRSAGKRGRRERGRERAPERQGRAGGRARRRRGREERADTDASGGGGERGKGRTKTQTNECCESNQRQRLIQASRTGSPYSFASGCPC